MITLVVIAGIFLALLVLVGLMAVSEILRAIKKDGLGIFCIRLLMGRHYSGHHHTNATFWRNSNGEIQGHARYHMARRYHRAGYKNLSKSLLYLWVLALIGYGAIADTTLTVILVCLSSLAGIGLWGYLTVRKIRRWYENRTLVSPMAKGLARITNQAEADVEKAIKLAPNWRMLSTGELGRIRLPDTFIGDDGQTDVITTFVERRFPKPVEISWQHKSPITVIIKASAPWPEKIVFMDRLSDIEACAPREYVGGYDRHNEPVILSHAGDMPMKGYCMNTGTGKTIRVLTTAAQLLANDPYCQLTGFDVKQTSLGILKGIPGVTIYDDPFNMLEMWNGWYEIKADMDRRYQEKKNTGRTDFRDHWIFLEEGNTFAVLIKMFYTKELRQKGESANPAIWADAIAPILWQGREVGIFVSAMLQNFMEKYFGNMSLRPAFNTIGMAGFKPSQYRTIIGTSPVPACQSGQGRMLICEPNREVWVQGMFDEKEKLRAYASRQRGIGEIV